MVLMGKKDIVEELVENMDNVLVLQDGGEQSCNHKVNHAKLVEKITGGYIEIDLATLTHQYSIMDFASKKVERECFEPYLQAMISVVLTLLQFPYLFDMLLPSQIRKSEYLWDVPFSNEGETLLQFIDFSEPAKHPIVNLES